METSLNKEFTVEEMTRLKGVSIVFMIFLHLFNRDWQGVYEPIILINNQPFAFLVSFFADVCLPVYLFCSGYGLYVSYTKNPDAYRKSNWKRIKKLMINFWIILLVFPVLLGLILNKDGFPGTVSKFILNVLALETSYSSIWWFLTIYIVLVILSPFLFSLVKRYPLWMLLPVSVGVFVAGHFQRYNTLLDSDMEILKWFYMKTALLCTSQFSFLIGAYFRKYRYYSNFVTWFRRIKLFNIWAIAGILLLIVIRSVIKTSIMAPFTAVPFIMFFTAIDYRGWWLAVWNFFGKHSTNIWLTHEFFFETFFKKEVNALKYAPFQFLGVVGASILSSYLIDYINKKVQKSI